MQARGATSPGAPAGARARGAACPRLRARRAGGGGPGRAAAPAAGAGSAAGADAALLPRSLQEMVDQAAAAVAAARAGGARRALVTLINPVNEKEASFVATEATDYPCSNMKEFETLVGVTRALLKGVLGRDVPLSLRRIDEGGIDGDLCATLSAGANGTDALAVIWPTAEKLKQIKAFAQARRGARGHGARPAPAGRRAAAARRAGRRSACAGAAAGARAWRGAQDASVGLLLVVNPLWKTEGNLVSELGIGPWRKANEEFLATFEKPYELYELRIGAPSSVDLATGTRYANGAVLRVLRVHGGQWVAHVVAGDGTSQAIGGFDSRPSYKELEALVDAARAARLEIFALARKASSLDREAGIRDPDDAGVVGEGDAEWYSPAQVDAMDAKSIRRALVGLGLPGAGTPAKLSQRALAVATAVAGGASLADAVEEARKLR
ncbi:hypothetical protein HT031_002734 [Scenedesmus sp. PABB004]|nr:hypothetical protein HT031_002734 [Scenedesmus sp. PABB004]